MVLPPSRISTYRADIPRHSPDWRTTMLVVIQGLHHKTDDLHAFAGLYEFWADPDLPEDDPGRRLLSFMVLTTTAHDFPGPRPRPGAGHHPAGHVRRLAELGHNR